jgi:hypothetical protein
MTSDHRNDASETVILKFAADHRDATDEKTIAGELSYFFESSCGSVLCRLSFYLPRARI